MFQSPSSISAVIMKQPQIISVSRIYIKISVLIVGWNRAALKAQGNVRCRNCLSWHILKGDRIPQPGHVTLLKSRVNHLIAHRFAQPHAYPPPSKMTVKPVRECLVFLFFLMCCCSYIYAQIRIVPDKITGQGDVGGAICLERRRIWLQIIFLGPLLHHFTALKCHLWNCILDSFPHLIHFLQTVNIGVITEDSYTM